MKIRIIKRELGEADLLWLDGEIDGRPFTVCLPMKSLMGGVPVGPTRSSSGLARTDSADTT